LLVKGVLKLKSRKQKPMLKEDAMQRQQRLIKLAQAGEQAERQLGLEEKEKKEDVNKHKWKGTM
jgi:hypothetical protein